MKTVMNIISPSVPNLLRYWAGVLIAAVLLLAFSSAQAVNNQTWLVFPQVDLSYRSAVNHSASPKRLELTPSVDFFYSSDSSEFKWLAEFFVSEERAEFERLQVGWSPNDDIVVWFGRFHNPLGFWNSLAQHGAYMQTAISRPHIIEYEHDGGALPSHLSGLMIQFSQPSGNGVWSYDLAMGYGPEMDTMLASVNILSPNLGRHRLGVTMRLSYQPQIFTSNKIGLFASSVTIPVRNNIYQEVDQTIVGVTGIWGWQSTELFGGLYYLDNRLKGANGDPRHSLISAYAQFDHAWRPAWAVYLRLENSSYKEDDPYLQLFPDIQKKRTAIGVRHELTFHQALKFEIRNGGHLDDNFTEFNVQWSAFFP